MDGVDEREQVCVLKWTHRPDACALAHELGSMFHWLGREKCHARASNQVPALKCKVYVPALLMLPHGYDDTGSAIRFEGAVGTTVECQREWLRHLSCDWWTVLVVRIAEEPRLAIMRYLDKDLPPL